MLSVSEQLLESRPLAPLTLSKAVSGYSSEKMIG